MWRSPREISTIHRQSSGNGSRRSWERKAPSPKVGAKMLPKTAWKMKEIGLKGRCSRVDISTYPRPPPECTNIYGFCTCLLRPIYFWGVFSLLFFPENSGQQPLYDGTNVKKRDGVSFHIKTVDPVHLFLSLSLETVFHRKPPPITILAVANINIHVCKLVARMKATAHCHFGSGL